MTAEQYPRQREPTVETIRAAQMSQTMMGIFFLSILGEKMSKPKVRGVLSKKITWIKSDHCY
jgi:hypothetical protein